MLKIAVCDDDTDELENTYNTIFSFTKEYNQTDFNIKCFHSPHDLLDCISSGLSFDLYLLDIVMPAIDGICVGEKIRESNQTAIIIYLTTSMDFAVKSYRVSAFDYLIKPVEQDFLFAVLKKAIEKIDVDKSKSMIVKTKDGIIVVPYHRIMYVELIERIAEYHLSDNSTVSSVTLRQPFEALSDQLLRDRRFIHPHVSYVVNMRFVSAITGHDFIMVDERPIPVSRNRYAEIKNNYFDFLLGLSD
ncbi:MAG TPA: LytTR family DNA-binding domain-containing protein [Oscillospiraceae bacterium]|nr:LytTR family DNA-binding domain-containing protein [Oscillospiraceae bacterium]